VKLSVNGLRENPYYEEKSIPEVQNSGGLNDRLLCVKYNGDPHTGHPEPFKNHTYLCPVL
jgi:hypothetical protein